MTNPQIIRLMYYTFYNPEDWERYLKWLTEVFIPFLMKSGLCVAWERYQLITKSPGYPPSVSISYHATLEQFLEYLQSPDTIAITRDIETTWHDKYERNFIVSYQHIKTITGNSIKEATGDKSNKPGTTIMHLEGINPTFADWGKFNKWLYQFGNVVFLPSLARLPGVVAIRRFWKLNVQWENGVPKLDSWNDPKYPLDLFVFEFEDAKARQNFEQSHELTAFRNALSAEFPNGLHYQWNVDYQLIQGWGRKNG
jgi:hypothetical protein